MLKTLTRINVSEKHIPIFDWDRICSFLSCVHLRFQCVGDQTRKSSTLNQSVSGGNGNSGGRRTGHRVLAMTGVRQMPIGVGDGPASGLLCLPSITTYAARSPAAARSAKITD